MRHYKFPRWSKHLYKGAIWDFFLDAKNEIYLTFDDGPDPEVTPWLLDLLDDFHAKATFFCLGTQVRDYPEIYHDILQRGHSVGSHGMEHKHFLGITTRNFESDLDLASTFIKSKLYRPPYGKITTAQYKRTVEKGYQVIYWSHISYDFDVDLASEKRMSLVKEASKPGAILVFHDSQKAFPQLKKELPDLLEFWKIEGFELVKI